MGPPGLEPISYIIENQCKRKSHSKNDCKNHCEMFDTKFFEFLVIKNSQMVICMTKSSEKRLSNFHFCFISLIKMPYSGSFYI